MVPQNHEVRGVCHHRSLLGGSLTDKASNSIMNPLTQGQRCLSPPSLLGGSLTDQASNSIMNPLTQGQWCLSPPELARWFTD